LPVWRKLIETLSPALVRVPRSTKQLLLLVVVLSTAAISRANGQRGLTPLNINQKLLKNPLFIYHFIYHLLCTNLKMNPITLFRHSRPEPQLNITPWKRIENTNPSTVTIVTSQSADGRKTTGTWICTPGKWEINYDKWEYCHIQEGHSIITPEGHEPMHVKAGDIFTIEAGTKGTWEVVETVRKYFIFVS
jgi:uncharacterized protein